MKKIIPTLDLTNFLSGNGSEKFAFVMSLKDAFQTTGFFFLKNHRISWQTLASARTIFDEFFLTLTDEQRKKYEYAAEQHQRGYTPMKIEKGEFANVADEKHFFQIGNERNVVVPDIRDFNLVSTNLFNDFRSTSLLLLRAIALSLNLKESYFAQKEGNSIMRAIDYPPTANPLVDDGEATRGGNITGMCASKHTDINMITLLEAKEEGLQLWYDDMWVPITISSPDLIIVNAGDMLQHLTGGRYISGLHRVVCQRNTRRFSIPYFCHINGNESVAPLKHLGESDLIKYPYKTAGEYLDVRLKQIGL